MKIIEVFTLFCKSFIKSKISACTVTSSAVVGSSASKISGSQIRAIAITILCLIPPENWCGYSLILSSALGIPTALIISSALAQASFLDAPLCLIKGSAIC